MKKITTIWYENEKGTMEKMETIKNGIFYDKEDCKIFKDSADETTLKLYATFVSFEDIKTIQNIFKQGYKAKVRKIDSHEIVS